MKFLIPALISLIVTFAWEMPSVLAQVKLKDQSQEIEMIELQARIQAAEIKKVHIKILKSGAMHRAFGVNEKKMLAWNGAGRRLYSSVGAAQSDGFIVWQFGPNSEATRFLDKQLREDGEEGYSDDLLCIMWGGLEFIQ